jgi:hypothetical protein
MTAINIALRQQREEGLRWIGADPGWKDLITAAIFDERWSLALSNATYYQRRNLSIVETRTWHWSMNATFKTR